MKLTEKETTLLKVISGLEDTTFVYEVVSNTLKPKSFTGIVNSLVKKGLITKEGNKYNELKCHMTEMGQDTVNGL